MKSANKKSKIWIAIGLTLCFSCKDLTDLNVNPNGVQPTNADPNLVMPYVLTEGPKTILNLSLGITSGIMQHTQLDGWYGDHNSYYFGRRDWRPYYEILGNNKVVYDRAVDLEYEFHQGVALVMKSMLFGQITDLWGDAPYTNALNAEGMGEEDIRPAFDDQETIYTGILADLEMANTLLSKSKSEYLGIDPAVDLIYGGDPARWRKLANSLQLRFYMRISSKKPDVARAGIEKIVSDPGKYPIITSASDDATLGFPGTTVNTAWPTAIAFDASQSGYSRIKMDSVFVDMLLQLDDPRIGVFAEKVEIPLLIDNTKPPKTDELTEINDKIYRVLSPDKVATISYNDNETYVGLPTQMEGPGSYNLNPNADDQGAFNPHVSQLNKVYKGSTGPLLKARMLSAAEVHFILAEAALKGWDVGDAEAHYNAGVQASFATWGISSQYTDYIAGNAAFNGTLEQVIVQKWITSWTNASEAWFDYRRTGFPVLHTGDYAFREVLPVRFPYGDPEIGQNGANVIKAQDKLKQTRFIGNDGANSAWSKPWLLQDTGMPWSD